MTTVCIDGYNLALPTGSGITTYARSLLNGITSAEMKAHVLHGPLTSIPSDPLLRETVVEDARLGAKAALLRPSRHLQVALARLGRKAWRVEPSGRILWPDTSGPPKADAFWLSEDLFRVASRAFSKSRTLTPVRFMTGEGSTPDIMHWTYPVALRAKNVPNIVTFHDLIPLKLPHTTLDDKQRYLDLCRKIVDRADHIVSVSETTRRDLVSILGVSEDRITNTWQSVDIPAESLSRDDVALAREIETVLNLPWKGYFIFFGAIEPKKNLGRLVEAYLRSGVQTPLVVVGGRAWLNEAEDGFLNELIAGKSEASGRLRRYDYLPRARLVDLIRGARATLFPSLYEGFGLPVLESMLLNTAVMASNAGSLPEVAGDAAVIVDPYDIDGMARAIREMDGDEGLRAELVHRGARQAEQFSPEAYADRLAALYRKVA